MKTIIHDPGYDLEKITEVYVFVSSGRDGEGVLGRNMDGPFGPIFMPFVCADKKRMESLKPLAKEIAKSTNRKVKLIRLSGREEIEEYNYAN